MKVTFQINTASDRIADCITLGRRILDIIEDHVAGQRWAPAETSNDPAPGHPELPLDAMIDAAQEKADALIDHLDAALEKSEPEFIPDPAPVEAQEYSTRLIVPIPVEMIPHLPDLPAGKNEWVGRGSKWPAPESLASIPVGDRVVYYWAGEAFTETSNFSGEFLFHIEAI